MFQVTSRETAISNNFIIAKTGRSMFLTPRNRFLFNDDEVISSIAVERLAGNLYEVVLKTRDEEERTPFFYTWICDKDGNIAGDEYITSFIRKGIVRAVNNIFRRFQ